MSALSSAVEKIKPQIAAKLGAMNTAARRRAIRQMCADADKKAEAVSRSLADRGEKNEDVWQKEKAAVEASYYAAIELFGDDCPRGEE